MTASNDDVPRASLQGRTLTVPMLKVLLQNCDHHSPTVKFKYHTHAEHIPTQLWTNTPPESMCIQQERLEQPLQHLKPVLMSDNAHNKRSTAGADPEVEEGVGGQT